MSTGRFILFVLGCFAATMLVISSPEDASWFIVGAYLLGYIEKAIDNNLKENE